MGAVCSSVLVYRAAKACVDKKATRPRQATVLDKLV